MEEKKNNVCSGGPTMIFACSGAADVGQISDLAARKLMQDGCGQMFCLAGIGGKIEPIMQKTAAASKILAIDGCTLDCAKKTLQAAGFPNHVQYRITDLGMEKGKSPASAENIIRAAAKGKELLEN